MNRYHRHRAVDPLRRGGGYRGTVLSLLLIFLAWTLLPGPAWAAEACQAQTAQLDYDDLTILQVTLDRNRLILSEALPAFETAQGIYLPLSELMHGFEFPIKVDPHQGHAEGWFLDERRRFTLDLAGRCRVSVAGASAAVDPVLISLQDDDLYIHSSLIEQWFPVLLEYDPSRLLLSVTAEEPLPVQQRLEREARWKRLGGRKPGEQQEYPSMDLPYRYWDWPFLDASANTRLRQGNTGETTQSNRYRIVGAGDLLKMNARFALSGNEQESIDDVTVTMGRRDPDGRLLGPLGAREYVFGDLGMARDPLVASNARGRGITISNFPLDRPQEFDRFSLEGELPLGWEVELYRNDQLMGFQADSGDGRYVFTDVPLEFGINRFRLVFHGPQGQTREEVVQRVIGPGMIRPGDQHYRITALRERDDRHMAGQDEVGERYQAAYELGVSRFLSLGGSARSLALDGERRNYATVHANAAIPRLFGRLEYATAQEVGGHAVSALLSTRLVGIDITGETAHFFDFDSERTRINQAPGEVLSRSELRMNTRLPRWGSFWTSLGATLDHDRGTLGERTGGQTRISVGGRHGTLTHLFEADRTTTDSRDYRRSRQRLLVSRRWRAVSLRGEVVQELVPEQSVSHIGASADWRLNSRATARVGVNRSMTRQMNTYSTGLSWQFDRISIGANMQATDAGEYTAGLSVSTGVARDPGRRRWEASSRSQTQTAAAAVNVFLDENNNGVRDPDEPVIPNALVQVPRSGARATTDANGKAFLTGLPTHRHVPVTLDTGSLENPFWTAENAGRQLVLRPGRTAEIAIPVLPTGGIEGTVYRAEGPQLRPATNLPVNAFNMEGELLQQTRSAYDGYYYMDGITPGYYRIRAGAAKDGRWPEPEDLIVEIQGGVMMVSGMDMILGTFTMDNSANTLVNQSTARPPSGASPAVTATASGFRTEKWILEQSPSAYTIQLMASGSEAAVQSYIERLGLLHQAAYFRSSRNGRPWYSVVYGGFTSRQQALDALRNLPSALREEGPWPRSFRELQEIIQRESHL